MKLETYKEKRDRLFGKNRPHIRLFDPNKNEDMAILWVAHKHKPFYELSEKIEQSIFCEKIKSLARETEILIIDDDNEQFPSRTGPVVVIWMFSDGWRYEPHAEFFPWASKRNIFRTSVAFLQFIRYQRQVGVCFIRSLEESKNLLEHCCEYGVLRPVGRVICGDPRGNEYLFSIEGKKKP